jgi:hypothetical protein
MSRLTSVVDEILTGTQFTLDEYTPAVVLDESAETILHEAADIAEQELKTRIPEPPVEAPKAAIPVKPLVAIAADGTEVVVNHNGAAINGDGLSNAFDVSSFLLEELVMDYVERNNGDLNIARCSQELNLPSGKVLEVLDALNGKGKITIQR